MVVRARHVIKRILNLHFLSQTASYDVASTIHQTLRPGPDVAPFGDLSLWHNPKWFSLVRRSFLDGSPSTEASSQIRLVAAGVVTSLGGAGGPGPGRA